LLTDPTANGVESYYCDLNSNGMQSEELADRVRENLAGLGLRDRGTLTNCSFAVLRLARVPAVLVEVGFHTNTSLAIGQAILDSERLADFDFPGDVGESIGIQTTLWCRAR